MTTKLGSRLIAFNAIKGLPTNHVHKINPIRDVVNSFKAILSKSLTTVSWLDESDNIIINDRRIEFIHAQVYVGMYIKLNMTMHDLPMIVCTLTDSFVLSSITLDLRSRNKNQMTLYNLISAELSTL